MLSKAAAKASVAVLCVSGGVDSSVAAFFAVQCVQSMRDVAALRQRILCQPALPVDTIARMIRDRVPAHQVSPVHGDPVGAQDMTPLAYRAVFMNNWRPGEHDGSTDRTQCEHTEADYHDACDAIQALVALSPQDAPASVSLLDFSAEYWHRCVHPLLCAYQGGYSCNVDTLCNSRIKFGALLEHCKNQYGDRTLLVTGHYARVVACSWTTGTEDTGSNSLYLARPLSIRKDLNDQTHFLSRLSCSSQLPHAVFPLGSVFGSKADVREVAKELGLLKISGKKTSTGVCFVEPQKMTGEKTKQRRPVVPSAPSRFAFSSWVHRLLQDESHAEPCTRGSQEHGGVFQRTRWFLLLRGNRDDNGKHFGKHLLQCSDDMLVDLDRCRFRVLPSSLSPPLANSSALLPCYALTKGQKIAVAFSLPPTLTGKRAWSDVRHAVLYVADIHRARGDSSSLMRRVVLSEAFDDKLMLQSRVAVGECTLPPELWVVAGLSVAFRHLDKLRKCTVVASGEEPRVACVELDGDCVRCPQAGQTVVFYIPFSQSPSDYLVVGTAVVL